MCIKFQPNRSTGEGDDTTFEGKKHKPKFKGQTLLVTVTNQQIVFLSSAFWGPPTADIIYGSPLTSLDMEEES